ncbi:unnamed protein product [Adineta ricciae]|uniref:Hexosyltransferase n=1 Tax=Adineta ricciae TaxID=249248 RepID=A0A814I1I0_ADIRI|nr:unnamed protein product [Adineta ricciae]CAF1246457.1 unnamed protein product [Adineta ricciae]
MWLLRRYGSVNFYFIALIILSIIAIYITFDGSQFRESLPSKILDIAATFDNTPVEYFHVDIDLTSSQAICQSDDILLVYILSTRSNFRRREIIRSTWGSKQNGTCFVFVIGEISGTEGNAAEIQMKVKDERQQFNDIIEINHIETYANVVYKEVGALQWSYQFYPNISYLFKTDDDLIVDTLLLSYMTKILVTNSKKTDSYILKYDPLLVANLLSSDRTTFFRGAWAIDFQLTGRGNGKFGVSETIWPHRFLPPYCSGFGWYMSNHVRNKLVYAANTYPLHKVVWIGDVFASGFLAKVAKVRCIPIPLAYDQSHFGNCSCLMASNPVLTVCSTTFHSGLGKTLEQKFDEYRKAWKIIQLRHNVTAMVTIDC